MWIVRYAIAHRHTVGVLAILLLLFGGLSARRMSTDILPTVNIPAINVIWTYAGLNAQEMASKLTSFSELAIMNNVDNIRELRSETLNGVAIVRVDFQPGTNVTNAFAQVTSVSQTILRRMPTGTTPPLIVPYIPSSVPVLQLVLASDTLSDGALYDYARLQLRAQIQSIPGIRLSLPYGGAARQVMIDLDPEALQAHGLSPSDVARAVGAQNLTLPSGTLRTGTREILITTNASPETVATFAELPLRSVQGRLIKIADVANVRDGQAVQTNVARLDGQNAVLVSILKLGNASTVDIVREIRARMPQLRAAAPEGVTIEPIFDQSIFVENAVDAIMKEGVIVGLLVAFVVVIFIGSWQSSLIVLTSIPLALLASVGGLMLTGQTFNLMTLGGLMLAIGILVDNALVEIENINRNLETGLGLRDAILKSASEVAFPEFVSTLSICIVFSPLFLLSGTAAFVFTPLALAVIFAMIASYLLSRTLVPSLASMMLSPHAHQETAGGFDGVIRRTAQGAGSFVGFLARHKSLPLAALAAVVAFGALTMTRLGSEFFPETDAGMIRIYLRSTPGQRLEETARVFADVQRSILGVIPESEIGFIAESIGAPEPVNLAWIESGVIGAFDGEILIQLGQEHAPTAGYVKAIRHTLRESYPGLTFYFRPADATAQTLAGSAQTAIEVRFIGRDGIGNSEAGRALQERMREIPGAVDVAIRQVRNLPSYFIEIDRTRALQIGITPQDASSAILAALGTGGTVSPTFWADPAVGSSYTVQIVAPPSNLTEMEQLLNTPVRSAENGRTVALRTIASVQLRNSPANIDRTTLMPTFTVLANVQGRDLGGVYADVAAAVADIEKRLKPGNRIEIAGQARSMTQAYAEMTGGIALAAVLVYLIMVVNFQSWLFPFIAMSGLPVAITGAMLALYVTGTPLSVPALTGLIMVIGVSTANSVLVTSFARDQLIQGATALEAAVEAARTRLRPVIMTATAMIVGILPMALGAGEGGEQNAPLGRAVVGGLMLGTIATLTLVPFLFAVFARRRPGQTAEEHNTEHSENPSHGIAKRDMIKPIVSASIALALAGGASYVLWTEHIAPRLTATANAKTVPSTAEQSAAAPLKTVRVVHPEPLQEAGTITITGRTAPAELAIVASRASGVASKRLVDIGDKVAADDVLLVIDAPEVEQELARARASVEQTKARLDLARVNAGRAEQLVKQGHVSTQQLDERTSNERVAIADLAAADAEVHRLTEVQGFLTVKAPFSGTVVSRTVERGDRISASQSEPSAALFTIARLDELRVELDIPQTDALKVRLGNAAKISFAELPGEVFEAKVMRRTGLIDQASSTMRAELVMANPEERIPAGLNGVVIINVSRDRVPVTVPTNTLVTRDGQQKVAIAELKDGEDIVSFRKVFVARDFGDRVEIVAGLEPADRVILSPNALLREGDKIAVTMATVSKATGQKTR